MIAINEDEGSYFEKVLKSALHHDRREKRREMIYILGELRDLRALDALKTIMTEDDPYLVSEAVKATGKINGPKAMEMLRIMMH
ncbi:MAG: repeat protein, partial [Euryarchaeota archaeon]|nr:repeat protein [Euryarchaeota archaeon]